MSIYERREVDLDNEYWLDDMEEVEKEAEEAVFECLQNEEFDHVIVECGYTYRFDEGEEHADDFLDLNAVCTESRINPKFSEDAKYIRLHYERSIVFKRDGFNLRDLMNVGHCGCFNFGSLITIKKDENALVLYFDTESG